MSQLGRFSRFDGDPRDASLIEQRIEHDQQVEIDTSHIGHGNNRTIKSRLDQSLSCAYLSRTTTIGRSAMQSAAIQMTSQQIALVRESFAKIVPASEQAAVLFYDRLFAVDPSTRPLFRGDMKSQGAKLMAAIGSVVEAPTASRR
jgi:hypothetical protein